MSSLLQQAFKTRILVLDGAMGTEIQNFNLTEEDYRSNDLKNHPKDLKGNHDLLVFSRPDVVKAVHQSYLAAGADLIETNTFNANAISQKEYGTEAWIYRINREAAMLAKEACQPYQKEKPRFVLGSIGPTSKTASMSPRVTEPQLREVSFDDLVKVYHEQMEGLVDGGVDALLIETVFDPLNAKAAIFAAENVFEIKKKRWPLIISGTITDNSGRLLTGQTVESFWASIRHAKPLAVGLNCALGAKKLAPFVNDLARIADTAILVYPNAGLPNELGLYDQSALQMSAEIKQLLEKGLVNAVGGCCGSTPEHIMEINKLASKFHPRNIPIQGKKPMLLSGLEVFSVDESKNFINIGERTNVTGSRQFLKLVQDQKWDDAIHIALLQVQGGAQLLDINMDDGLLESEQLMKEFVNRLLAEPEIAKIPFVIDSSKWDVLLAGLKSLPGKGVVNSLSLKDGEELFLARAKMVMRLGAAVIVMAFDEKGQAEDYHARLRILERAYLLLTEKIGFAPEDIILDPNIYAIATGIEEHRYYGKDYIDSVAWIKKNLPGVSISGGVSNISFSFRGNHYFREAIHAVFLYQAIQKGMNMGIVNAGSALQYDDVPDDIRDAMNAVLKAEDGADEALIALAEKYQDQKVGNFSQVDTSWRQEDLEARLKTAMIRGDATHIEEDIVEALEKYERALTIIEGPLMDGMQVVGDLFGAGKLFLPQVVKSARAMKKAVALVTPHMKPDSQGQKKPKIILATVKGDVHDIGKNIVGVVLSCNNFDIVDLGVMVSAETIIEAAKEHQAVAIGLSGLITPSLDEMVHVAKLMQEEKLKLPLLIGGATTSKIHTAIKIDPMYDELVVHIKDASEGVVEISRILKNYEEFTQNKKREYEEIRARRKNSSNHCSLFEARLNQDYVDWNNYNSPKPSLLFHRKIINPPLDILKNFIDWTPFFQAWEMKGRFPGVLQDPIYGQEAEKLWDDTQNLFAKIEKNNMLQPVAVCEFFRASSFDEQVAIYNNSGEKLKTFYFLRQQMKKSLRNGENSPNLSLADWIRPYENPGEDYLGLFALNSGDSVDVWVQKFEDDGDDYSAILFKLIADRVAEALAEWLHLEVRKNIWGYARDESDDLETLLKEKYQGIRPAPGYGACPDHFQKKAIFDLLDAEKLGMRLTENGAMWPQASICGFYFSHPAARYFGVGKVASDQLQDYAKVLDLTQKEAEKWLSAVL